MTPEQKRKQQAKHDCAKPVHNRQMHNDRHFDVSAVKKPTLDTCNLDISKMGTLPYPGDEALVDGAPPDNLPADTTNVYVTPTNVAQRVIINSIVSRSGASFGDVIYAKDVAPDFGHVHKKIEDTDIFMVDVLYENAETVKPDADGHVTIKFKYSFEVAPATYMYGAEAHDMIAQSVLERGGVETTVPFERKVHFPATLKGHQWWTPAGVVREQTIHEAMTKPNRNGVVYTGLCSDEEHIVVEGGECVLNPNITMTFEEEPTIRSYMDRWLDMIRKPNKETE